MEGLVEISPSSEDSGGLYFPDFLAEACQLVEIGFSMQGWLEQSRQMNNSRSIVLPVRVPTTSSEIAHRQKMAEGPRS